MEKKAPFDPYALSPAAIREPPQTLWQALRQIGPGLILAGTIVGTGELIATTNVGAQAGFALLWLVIWSCFIKVFVQIELGRYTISAGQTTLATFCQLPGAGRLLAWWWLIMMLVTQTQIGAMLGGVGQALHMAVPGVPPLAWVILTAVVTAGLLVTGSYRVVERVTTLLVVTFTLMTITCVALLPWTDYAFRWDELASGFTLQLPPHALVAAFAMIGITGVGASELVSYPYWCIEKGYARNVGPHNDSPEWEHRARGWLRVMRLDAWVSMVIYTVATLAFYLLGAAVLYPRTGGQGLPNPAADLLSELEQMYIPVLGADLARWFIVIGVFAVLYSTLFAATAGNSRMLTDFLRLKGFIQVKTHEERLWWVRVFCIGFPVLGLVLYLLIENPVLMVTIGGIIQAVTLPLLAEAAVYLRYQRTDRRITPGLVWDHFLWLSLLALAVAAAYGVWTEGRKLLG